MLTQVPRPSEFAFDVASAAPHCPDQNLLNLLFALLLSCWCVGWCVGEGRSGHSLLLETRPRHQGTSEYSVLYSCLLVYCSTPPARCWWLCGGGSPDPAIRAWSHKCVWNHGGINPGFSVLN